MPIHPIKFLSFALLAVLAATSTRAACNSPAGTERDLIYDRDYHVYQFCNGTAWIGVRP